MDLTLTLTGIVPLIVQSDRLVDPLDPLAREIRKLVKKGTRRTDEDHEQIGRLEFEASLYHDREAGPYLPGVNIEASLKAGGSAAGRLGAAVQSAVIVLEDVNPIEYPAEATESGRKWTPGPREIPALWNDTYFRFRRSVNTGTKASAKRVMRVRPIFRQWRVRTTVRLATDLLNLADFERAAKAAGAMVGVGTWRPRHGRYEVEIKRS